MLIEFVDASSLTTLARGTNEGLHTFAARSDPIAVPPLKEEIQICSHWDVRRL